MAKKHGEEEPEPKTTHVTPKKSHTPKKPRVHTSKMSSGDMPIPSMTEEQTQAYMNFSEACKKVYKKFSKSEIDTRIIQLESSPALIAVVRFMVMMHDLLRMYGVMQFNKIVSPTLYKHLDDVQEQTGQKLPLARVLLDGIKTTKMELLSGVTIHPLPEFEEPEYETMTTNTPDPVDPTDEEFEPQDAPEGQEQYIGPGGPAFDPSIIPESGTPVDPPINPPPSIEEEAPPEEFEEAPPEEPE